MHRLLMRQINKARGADQEVQLETLLRLVSETYCDQEADRIRLERASKLMSEELGELNRALESRRVEAELANSAKSQFLANMSHEIRTPLNGVIALADALCASDLSARQREMVELVRTSGATLERLLTDILDFSKIEAGKLEMKEEAFQLRECIAAAAHVLQAKADEKNISFNVEYQESARGEFIGDPVRIRQIVTNLASNAIKFTAVGSVTIRVAVEDPAMPYEPSIVRITVQDTGIGFDAEAGARLFGRFEQADSSITRTYGGTGLGLSISRSLSRAMGGDISATSTPGVGSTFEARLVLVRARPEPVVRPGHSAMSGELDLSTLRLLVVEDNAVNRRVIQLLLAPIGLTITFAENGAAGVEAFTSGQFSLVLMDMQMPVMDGLTATRRIRAWEREAGALRTPLIVLSANAMEDQLRQSIDAGADLHVAKPFTLETLLSAIRKVMLDREWIASDGRKSA